MTWGNVISVSTPHDDKFSVSNSLIIYYALINRVKISDPRSNSLVPSESRTTLLRTKQESAPPSSLPVFSGSIKGVRENISVIRGITSEIGVINCRGFPGWRIMICNLKFKVVVKRIYLYIF